MIAPTDYAAPVHMSLVRPILIAGAERRIVILAATLVAVLLLGIGLYPATIGASLVVAFGIHPFLVRAGRKDPQALAVYARSLSYQTFYPRAAHPGAPAAAYPTIDFE